MYFFFIAVSDYAGFSIKAPKQLEFPDTSNKYRYISTNLHKRLSNYVLTLLPRGPLMKAA